MKDLVLQLGNINFKPGIMLGAGAKTCNGGAGSLGKEAVHAKQVITDWGFVYVKYDGSCYGNTELETKTSLFKRNFDMARAIHN
jgi:hypothetical protein